MIAKSNKQPYFAPSINYNAKKAKPLMTNCCSESPRELDREMQAVAAVNPAVRKPARHDVLSLSDECLTEQEWRQAVSMFLEGMQARRAQFCVWLHADTDNQHVHLVSNRVRPDGTVISDSFDFFRAQLLCRRIEKQFGLAHVRSSWEIPPSERRRHLSPQERATGLLLPQSIIAETAESVFSEYGTDLDFSQFATLMEFGRVRVNLHLREERYPYLLYSYNGRSFRGHKIAMAYSLPGLIDRGIRFPTLEPHIVERLTFRPPEVSVGDPNGMRMSA